MEQFSDKSRLGKMSSFLADPSSSSANGHFNLCRIESILIATDLSQDEIKKTVEWLKKAQSNLTNIHQSIDDLSNAIHEGEIFLPSLKSKVNAFVESGQPMNLTQAQLYYERQQQEQLQKLNQPTIKTPLDSNMTDSASSLTDVESCHSNQSPRDNDICGDHYMGDFFNKMKNPRIKDIYSTSYNPKKRPREFSSLSVIEQMEIEKTAGLLMGFGVPSPVT
jgi:hypothetical protein